MNTSQLHQFIYSEINKSYQKHLQKHPLLVPMALELPDTIHVIKDYVCTSFITTLFLTGWRNWNQTSCQQDVKMSWRGQQLKRPPIRAGSFYFCHSFDLAPFFMASPLSSMPDRTAILCRLVKERYCHSSLPVLCSWLCWVVFSISLSTANMWTFFSPSYHFW